jgi:4-amino-4-deoxy-L-arabinose transferase-like glycosyltransferase
MSTASTEGAFASGPAWARGGRAASIPRTRSATATAAVLCAILVVAAGVRLATARGYWGADDGEYALLANAMASGDYWAFVNDNYVERFNGPAHLPYRFALIAPLALVFRVFGVSEPALIAYPLLISILGVVLAFACGRLFFGPLGGLVAAALVALVPVDIQYATMFLPDGIASFYASLAVLTVLTFGAATHARPRTLFVAGLGAGCLFAVSWLAKESVAYLVPFCAVLIVMGIRDDFRRTLPLWLGVAVASGGVLLVEMGYYAVARGDFMLRIHENERSFVQTQSYLFYEGSRFGWPVGGSRAAALVKRLFLSGPSVIFLDPGFLYLPLFGLVAAARGLFWKDTAFKIPALWMITLILMYNFASPTFKSYTPLVLLHRYLHPLVLPAAVLTAGLIVRLLAGRQGEGLAARREQVFWGALASAALVAVGAYATFRGVRDFSQARPMFETAQVAALVGPDDTVYADPLSRKALEFQWKYPDRTRIVDFEGMEASGVGQNSFVLVDANRLNWLDVNVSMWLTHDYGYHEPAFATKAPPSWTRVWRNEYATLYRVE